MINETDLVEEMDSQGSMTALRLLARWALRKTRRMGDAPSDRAKSGVILDISKGYASKKPDKLT